MIELRYKTQNDKMKMHNVIIEQPPRLMSHQIYTCQMWAEKIRFWSKKFVELASPCSYI